MEKIRIKELIEFKRKSSDKSKKNFAFNLKNRKIVEKKKEDKNKGGDYWVQSTSCIQNVFKYNDVKFYEEKIIDISNQIDASEVEKTKSRFAKNIKILSNFKDFDLLDLKPKSTIDFETIHKEFNTIDLHGLPLYIHPNLIFSFENNGKKQIGALYLVAQINGFTKPELGVFCEVLYYYLIKNYAADYQINPEYCIAIDTFDAQKISFQDLLNGEIPFLLEKIIKDIKSL